MYIEGYQTQTNIFLQCELSKISKIVEPFQKHFNELLNNSDTNENIAKYERVSYQTAESKTSDPKTEEIELTIKTLKNYKSPGEEEINPELI